MRFGMKTLDDVEVKGKTVLCRVTVSEPLDPETGDFLDSTRLRACVPTIRELADRGARVVLLGHQGSDTDYGNYGSTEPHARALAQMLCREVSFVDAVCGAAARDAVRGMENGGVVLLENVCYLAEESVLFEHSLRLTPEQQAKTVLVRTLAPLADLYVCDAFASAHRSQPSLCGFERLLPSAMGRLFEAEFAELTRLMEQPERPCVFVLGGAKPEAAFRIMRTALDRRIADRVLVGGLVGLVLLDAGGYEIGAPSRARIRELGYEPLQREAGGLLDRYHSRIVLPTDYGYVKNGKRREAMLHALPPGELVTDIGVGTAELFRNSILEAKTVFANGPMGVYEDPESERGTRAVWDALGDTQGHTVIGGADSIAATTRYGKTERINFISTGDGALIHLLSGEELPVVKALRRACETRTGDRAVRV